jgi:hypothetical protein
MAQMTTGFVTVLFAIRADGDTKATGPETIVFICGKEQH